MNAIAKDAEKLADLAEECLALIDEEMEHGCYQTPECVPSQYEDEDDYYGEHDKITDKVVDCRIRLRKAIAEIRKNLKNAA